MNEEFEVVRYSLKRLLLHLAVQCDDPELELNALLKEVIEELTVELQQEKDVKRCANTH